MATGDIVSVSINADGWSADVTVEGWAGSGGSITYDYGTPESGSGNMTFTVTSEGYNSSGVLGTTTRTVYGTKTVRQPYPNEASLDEVDSGGDIVIRVALSDEIYNDDKNGGAGTSGTDPTVTIAGGWANNGSNNTAATDLGVTNNSALDYPKVIGQWDWSLVKGWHRVESNFSVGFRARHGFGIAAVVLSAIGAVSAVDQNSTETSLTKQGPLQNGLYHESYSFDVTLSSYTQGEQIDLRAIAYPTVGDADSLLDTNNTTAASSRISGITTCYVLCDKTGAMRVFGVVDGDTGNDGTGVASGTLATAEASPYLTVGAAISDGANVVYVNNTTAVPDILGSNPTDQGFNYAIEVQEHPTDPGQSLNRGGSFRTYEQNFITYKNLTISYSSGNGWLDGEAVAGRQIWFDSVTFSNSAAPIVGLGYRSEGCWFVECGGMGTDNYDDFSSARLAYSLTGCTFTSNAVVSSSPYTVIGCNSSSVAQIKFSDGTSSNPASPMTNAMFEHNAFLDLTMNSGSHTVFQFGDETPAHNLVDIAIIGNVVEYSNVIASGQALFVGGDGHTGEAKNCILAHNTLLGSRCNLFYNDTGATANVRNRIFYQCNAIQSYNIKSDIAGTPNGNRVGNWAQLYGCNYKNSRHDGTASSAFTNEYDGLDVSFVTGKNQTFGQLDFEDDQSVDGGAGGNGDYTPVTGDLITGVALLNTHIDIDLEGSGLASDVIGALSYPENVAAAIAGTVGDGATETQIVTGGGTITITLTDDTWVASGSAFDGQRQNIIDGLDSAQSEATGWNAEVRDKEVVGAVARTSDTVATITLTAAAAYDISANETITVTVPATALVMSTSNLVGSPTFQITPVISGATGGKQIVSHDGALNRTVSHAGNLNRTVSHDGPLNRTVSHTGKLS